MQTAELKHGAMRICYDPAILPSCDPSLFDPQWLRDTGKLRATSRGRNTAYFLTHDGVDMVLRHYYRGGLIGRINKDLFLRQPLQKTRPMAEFSLLSWMHAQGLPVPRPVAARFAPVGLCYRADILTQTIPDTETLADRLRAAALSAEVWQRVGETVARLHKAGVMHSDLNCRNILIDHASDIWVIDFDKCQRLEAGAWRDQNLERLKRSFLKEASKQPDLHWDEACWADLMEGYRSLTS